MLSVNLVYGTYGESGILTSINNTKKMLRLLESEGVRFYQNSIRICDVMHAHTFGPIALLLALLHKARHKTVIIHAHTTPQDVANSYFGATFISACLKGYLGFFYNLADVCIAPSAYTKEMSKSTLNIMHRITFLSNDIDLSSHHSDETRALEFLTLYALHDRPLFLSIFLFFFLKNIIYFFHTTIKLPLFLFSFLLFPLLHSLPKLLNIFSKLLSYFLFTYLIHIIL